MPSETTNRLTPNRLVPTGVDRDRTPAFREPPGRLVQLTRTDAGDARLVRHEGAGKVAARPQDHESVHSPEVIAGRGRSKPGPPASAPFTPQTLPFRRTSRFRALGRATGMNTGPIARLKTRSSSNRSSDTLNALNRHDQTPFRDAPSCSASFPTSPGDTHCRWLTLRQPTHPTPLIGACSRWPTRTRYQSHSCRRPNQSRPDACLVHFKVLFDTQQYPISIYSSSSGQFGPDQFLPRSFGTY